MNSHAKAVHQVGQRVLEGEVMVYARVGEGVRWPLRQPCLGPIRAPQALVPQPDFNVVSTSLIFNVKYLP